MSFIIHQEGLLIAVGRPMNVEGVGPENLAFRYSMADDQGAVNKYEVTFGRSASDPKTCVIFVDALCRVSRSDLAQRIPVLIAGIQFADVASPLPDTAQDACKTIKAVRGTYDAQTMIANDSCRVMQRTGESPDQLLNRLGRLREFICKKMEMLSGELDTVIRHGKNLRIQQG